MKDPANQVPTNFRAALAIASENLSIADITGAMTREPDRAYDIGSPLPNGRPRTWSKWLLELTFDDALHRGCDGLSQAIVDLSDDVADRAAELESRGCSVTISVEQHIDPEDSSSDGIHVDESAIAWLARARASLDIDQYAADATFRRAARLWLEGRVWDLRGLRWFVWRRLPATFRP